MLDPEIELFPQSSPTISSISSSDFDTESTGSFFHDRSTSLGTLMGVSFPAIALRVSSRRENNTTTANGGATNSNGGGGKKKKKKKKKVMRKVVVVDSSSTERRRRWWKLCRDEETRPSSLADFLEVERRFGDDEVFYSETAELEGIVHHHHHHHQQQHHHSPSVNGNGRVLFADGRVLPPPPSSSSSSQAVAAVAAPPITEILCRFPVLLSGICSGGGPPGRGGGG